MLIKKVISGGQSGADQAGLAAARAAGVETGGWAPKFWSTSGGPREKLLKMYGLNEYPIFGYSARTEANVRDSDGTIRFAVDFSSYGERCTMRAIVEHRKPYFDVRILESSFMQKADGTRIKAKPGYWSFLYDASVDQVIFWLTRHNIKVLNVAGNRQRVVGPDVYNSTLTFLEKLFDTLKNRENRR